MTSPAGQTPTTLRYDRNWLEPAFASIALFACLVASVLTTAGYLGRLGFADNSAASWMRYMGLSWFLLHFSFLVRRGLTWLGVNLGTHWWASHPALTLAALALLTTAGVEQSAVARTALYLFVIAGTVGMLARGIWLLPRARGRDWAVLIGFSFCFGLYAVGASWGLGYQNPVFVEGMAGGRAQIDTLFHATLANMLRTYGVPTTGLDGLRFVHYHFGSHWIFARLCNLLDVPVLDFYCRGYPILFVPLGVFSLGAFALTLHSRWQSFRELAEPDVKVPVEAPPGAPGVIGPLFWFVLMLVYAGFLPDSAGFLSAASQNSVIVSESYGVGISVALLGIAVAFAFFRDSYDSPDLWMADRVLGLLALPLIAGAVGFLKVSIMLVLTAAAAVLYLRVRPHIYRKGAAGTLLLGSAILVYAAYVFTANPEYEAMSRFAPFGFLRGNVALPWWPYFWIVYFAWCWILAAARLREEGIATVHELATALREGRLLDLEFVAAIAVFGASPGLVLTTDSSTHYFSDVQRWIAAGLVLAAIIRHALPADNVERLAEQSQSVKSRKPVPGLGRVGKIRTTQLLAAALVIALAGTVSLNTVGLLGGALDAVLAARHLASQNPDRPSSLFDRGLSPAMATIEAGSKEVQQHFATDKNILAVLRSLERIPLAERRRSLLYIPKTDLHYWKLLRGPYSPKDAPLVAPALSGIAMIDGLYERPEGDFWTGYGYQHYEMPIVNVQRPPLSEYLPTLKRRCHEMGFEQLIVVDSDPNGITKIRKYDCTRGEIETSPATH